MAIVATLNATTTMNHLNPESSLDAAAAECAAFLNSYLSLYPDWLADSSDPEYTSWNAVSLVLLAAAFFRAQPPLLLSKATGFPLRFTDLVVRLTDSQDRWTSDAFLDLVHTLENQLHDLVEVHSSLDAMHETVLTWLTPQISTWLHTARAGVLFGGGQETEDQYADEP